MMYYCKWLDIINYYYMIMFYVSTNYCQLTTHHVHSWVSNTFHENNWHEMCLAWMEESLTTSTLW
jgi:hypothetical protein